MSDPVRRAGRAVLDDGSELVWSVADGRRGRRWRTQTLRDGRLIESVLLEVDGAGRPARVEVTAAGGLLTLHPEPTGGLHGNVVSASGVRHLAVGWSDEHELAIDRLPIVAAITLNRLETTVSVGEGRVVPVVVIGAELQLGEAVRRFDRMTATAWRIEGEGGRRTVSIDDRGMPIWPSPRGETDGAGEAAEWPLELDPQR